MKQRDAFLLLICSVVLGMIVFTNDFSLMTELLMITFAVIAAVMSTVYYMNLGVETIAPSIEQRVKEAMPGIADDIEDIKNLRFTGTQFSLIVCGLATIASLYYMVTYNKFGASWWGINVFLYAFVAVVLVVLLVTQTDWFRDEYFRTPMWMFVVLMSALILSIGLGLYMTEPIEIGGPTQYQVEHPSSNESTADSEEYDYQRTRASTFFYMPRSQTSSGQSSSSSGISCTGKGCGEGILFLLIIVLVLILVIGSAFIAHFWVFSACVILALMWLFAIHELRVRPHFLDDVFATLRRGRY